MARSFPALPSYESLGRAPVLSPASPVAVEGPPQPGTDPVPSALARAGAEIQGTAAYALRYATHAQTTSELSHAQTALMQSDLDIRDKLQKDPNSYQTWENSYLEQMKQARNTIAGTITDDAAKRMFAEDADANTVRWREQIRGAARNQEVDHGRASLLTVFNTGLNRTYLDDDDRASQSQAVHEAINGAQGSGYITADEAVKQHITYDAASAEARLLQMPPADRAAVLAGTMPAPTRPGGLAPQGEAAPGRKGPGQVRADWDALITSLAPSSAAAARMRNYVLIENPKQNSGEVNPKSGAAGPIQFLPSTARDLGLADPKDAGQSFRKGFQLDARNEAQLTTALGRQPTDAELYLAWQQGAGGAAALLKNPNANAIAALTPAHKGDANIARDAVIDNGGRESMTAGQFAQIWFDTYARKSGGVEPGQTAVATQRADWIQALGPVKREEMRITAENQARQLDNAREVELNRRWNVIQPDLARGIVPAEFEPLLQEAAGTRVGGEMAAAKMVVDAHRTFLSKPVKEQEAVLAAGPSPDPSRPPTHLESTIYEEQRKAYDAFITEAVKDPTAAYAMQSGNPPPPLDFSDPRSVDARTAWAEGGTAYYGGQTAMPLMNVPEQKQWLERFKNAESAAQAGQLAQIGNLNARIRTPLLTSIEKTRGTDDTVPAGGLARLAEIAVQDPARAATLLGMLRNKVDLPGEDVKTIEQGADAAVVSGAGAVVQANLELSGNSDVLGVKHRDYEMIVQVAKGLVSSGKATVSGAPAMAASLLRGSDKYINSTSAKVLLPHDYSDADTVTFDAGLRDIQERQVRGFVEGAPVDLATFPPEQRGEKELEIRQKHELAGRYVSDGVWINDASGGVALILPGLPAQQVPAATMSFDTVLAMGREAVDRPIAAAVEEANRVAAAAGVASQAEPLPTIGITTRYEPPPRPQLNPEWDAWVQRMRRTLFGPITPATPREELPLPAETDLETRRNPPPSAGLR